MKKRLGDRLVACLEFERPGAHYLESGLPGGDRDPRSGKTVWRMRYILSHEQKWRPAVQGDKVARLSKRRASLRDSFRRGAG